MSGQPKISRIDDAFNSYITSSTTYLLLEPVPGTANWQRLGLTQPEMDAWTAFRDNWIIVYPKYVDEGQRTVPIKNEKNLTKKNFIIHASPILLRLQPQSALLTETDRSTLNLPVYDVNPTPRGPITGVPVNDVKAIAGGTMHFKVRVSEDASRPSKHPLSDGVAVCYVILEQTAQPPAAPTNENCPNTYFSSKASFKLALGVNVTGKKVCGFTRWVNISNLNNSGEWGPLFQATIV